MSLLDFLGSRLTYVLSACPHPRCYPTTALLMDFLNTQEKRDRRLVHLPMGRFGEAVEVAKGALFRT